MEETEKREDEQCRDVISLSLSVPRGASSVASANFGGSPREIEASDVDILRRRSAIASTMTTTHGGHVYYVIKVPKDDGNER